MKKIFSFLFLLIIMVYQKVISPFIPKRCRFLPTCSQYMIESIQEWGSLKGFCLGLKRLFKCHPWGKHGYDPVPKKD